MYETIAEEFRPEGKITDEKRGFELGELQSAKFTLGVSPWVCLGKDIARMEIYKPLPEVSVSNTHKANFHELNLEIVLRFDVELEWQGRSAVNSGAAYNAGFIGKLSARD
jgi:hypothetical protein